MYGPGSSQAFTVLPACHCISAVGNRGCLEQVSITAFVHYFLHAVKLAILKVAEDAVNEETEHAW